MSKKILTAIFLVLPVVAFAEDSALFQAVIFSGSVERFMEIANLLVALLAGIYAVKLAALSQGGTMEKTWNVLAVAALLFVLLEVVGALKEFAIVNVSGLGEIVEFILIVVFAYCLYFTRKDLLKKMLGN
jgi:hypothetical protein